MILSKNFYSFTEAKRFYNYQMRIPQPFDIYLIEDHESIRFRPPIAGEAFALRALEDEREARLRLSLDGGRSPSSNEEAKQHVRYRGGLVGPNVEHKFVPEFSN